MNQKKTSFLLVAAGVMYAIFLYGKTTAAKNLKVLFSNIKFAKASSGNLFTLIVNFRVVNPSSTPIRLESIVGDLFINGKMFSAVSQTIPFSIPANNVSMYSIKVETGILQAIQTVLNLIKEHKQLTVTFKGVANTTGFIIPIEQTIIQV